MREIYDWTKWFTELARKIAEGGETYLASAAITHFSQVEEAEEVA